MSSDKKEDTVAFYLSDCIECHGCSGKGWVENSKGDIKKCPICDGTGKLKRKVKPCGKATEYPPWYVPCDPIYPLKVWCTATTGKKYDGFTITHGE